MPLQTVTENDRVREIEREKERENRSNISLISEHKNSFGNVSMAMARS